MKRIVIKIGTKILTTATNKLDLDNLQHLVNQIALIKKKKGLDIILVSSGAIICGAEKMGIAPVTMPEKQAAASVGQPSLLKEYHHFFERQGINIGQILLTEDIMQDEVKKENVKNTINTLLSQDIVPIINENDSVSTEEIQFGDNDLLASMVSIIVGADQLILLTDQDGLFDDNPNKNPNASIIRHVSKVTDDMIAACDSDIDSKGKGGIKSKLISAKNLLEHNIITVIANGRSTDVINDILNGKERGTWFKY